MIDPIMRRNLFSATVMVISLAITPLTGPALSKFINLQIMGTQITPGLILGGIGIIIAYMLWQRRI